MSRKLALVLIFAAALAFTGATFGIQCQVGWEDQDLTEMLLEPPIENPDGSECCYDHNEEGPFGDRGVYRCEDADGNAYTGYGPPR